MGVFVGLGSQLYIEVSSSWVLVGNVTSIDGPDMSVGTVERKALSLTTARRRLATITDYGSVTGSLELDPSDASWGHLQAVIASRAITDFKIVWSDDADTDCTFAAILSKLSVKGVAEDSIVTADFEMQIDGAVDWTP